MQDMLSGSSSSKFAKGISSCVYCAGYPLGADVTLPNLYKLILDKPQANLSQ